MWDDGEWRDSTSGVEDHHRFDLNYGLNPLSPAIHTLCGERHRLTYLASVGKNEICTPIKSSS